MQFIYQFETKHDGLKGAATQNSNKMENLSAEEEASLNANILRALRHAAQVTEGSSPHYSGGLLYTVYSARAGEHATRYHEYPVGHPPIAFAIIDQGPLPGWAENWVFEPDDGNCYPAPGMTWVPPNKFQLEEDDADE